MPGEKNIKISITGDLGSGKSSVCNVIKEKYGFEIYHTGKIQREIAERYNMTTLELNKYAETHPEIDREIDGALAEVGKKPGCMILDSRMAWHFVPNSFKVYLRVNIDVSAKRVMNMKRGKVEQYGSLEEAKQGILQRKASENRRYLEKYGVDCSDMNNFDLIIDTSFCDIETIADTIIANEQKWRGGEDYPRVWLSSRFIFPTDRPKNEDATSQAGSIASVIEYEGNFYVYGDHGTVSRSILNGVDLIPVHVSAKNGELLPEGISAEEYVRLNYSPEKTEEWENFHDFKFPGYPEIHK